MFEKKNYTGIYKKALFSNDAKIFMLYVMHQKVINIWNSKHYIIIKYLLYNG